jgi:uncharacterized SAM-binding protein YcdF (DUF218 family)
MSFSAVRGVVVYPLLEHDPKASGDAAYVMAGGAPYYERLRAASDLYHMGRVPRIMILDEQQSAGYDFSLRRSRRKVERAIDYLALYGVPREKIRTVRVEGSTTFGSLSEARAVAREEPALQRLVVVTSAPHTRRSGLCFRRSLPDDVRVQVYSATEPSHSGEIHWPIWIEYVKLVVYSVVA